MLILSRQKDEKIYIGDNIIVEVVEIRGNRVRLGIVAPPDVIVLREEVKLRQEAQQENST